MKSDCQWKKVDKKWDVYNCFVLNIVENGIPNRVGATRAVARWVHPAPNGAVGDREGRPYAEKGAKKPGGIASSRPGVSQYASFASRMSSGP